MGAFIFLQKMTILADIDIERIISSMLIGVIVSAVLGFLYRSARHDSKAEIFEKCVEYPKAPKVIVWLGWVFTVVIAIVAIFTAGGDDFWPAVLLVLLFAGLILPLHLEFYFVRVVWDDHSIYTRSPWRRSRTIPFSSVTRCDFSQSMQWYRVYTNDHGIIRLSMFARGIPHLLEALPVSNPGCPPN